MSEFAALREANTTRQKEWDTGGKMTPSYMGNEMAGEVGEACNVIKKLERESFGMAGSRASVDDLAKELGDVVICADLIAARYGINLWEAVTNKFNATSVKNRLVTQLPRFETDKDREEKALYDKCRCEGGRGCCPRCYE